MRHIINFAWIILIIQTLILTKIICESYLIFPVGHWLFYPSLLFAKHQVVFFFHKKWNIVSTYFWLNLLYILKLNCFLSSGEKMYTSWKRWHIVMFHFNKSSRITIQKYFSYLICLKLYSKSFLGTVRDFTMRSHPILLSSSSCVHRSL